METIHSSNIPDIDIKSISLITLKNGNIIMIDDSVEEKPRKKITQINLESSKKEKKFQHLSVSKHSTYYFKARSHNNKNDDKKKLIIKNDFNLISKISKNISFSYYRKPKKNIQILNTNTNSNKNPNIPINKFGENTKINNMKISKSSNNINPIYNPQKNDKLNSKILLNENKTKFIQLDETNYLIYFLDLPI